MRLIIKPIVLSECRFDTTMTYPTSRAVCLGNTGFNNIPLSVLQADVRCIQCPREGCEVVYQTLYL